MSTIEKRDDDFRVNWSMTIWGSTFSKIKGLTKPQTQEVRRKLEKELDKILKQYA